MLLKQPRLMLRSLAMALSLIPSGVTFPDRLALAVDVEATNCGVAAGGNITAQEIVINCGISEQTIRFLVAEILEIEEKRDTHYLRQVSQITYDFGKQLGIKQSAIENFFRIIGQQQVPDDNQYHVFVQAREKRCLVYAAASPAKGCAPTTDHRRARGTDNSQGCRIQPSIYRRPKFQP